MADKKIKSPKFQSPRGRLGWPKLNEPDFGNEKFPKPDGEYSTKLILRADDPETQKFIKLLQPHYDAAMEAARAEFAKLPVGTRKKLRDITEQPFYAEVFDKETEEPTGEVEFKFAMKASGEFKKGPKAGQKWNATLPIFDRFGARIAKPPAIWGGTEARVSFELGLSGGWDVPGYFIPGTGLAGLKLALGAVKVLKLANGRDRSASDYGFGGEEDGDDLVERDEADTSDDSGDGDANDNAGGTPDF